MSASSVLQTRMQQNAAEERSRAIRALLATPLLTADADPVGFDAVRAHADHLRQWFDDTCGWTLHVETRRGYARLVKVSPDPDMTRPARRRRSGQAPFDRRRYVMVCLLAAELARPGAMTTIGLLAERVRTATATESAIATFDTANRNERSAFVDAIKLLEHYGVMQAVDGLSDAYVDSPDAKVLYQVDEARLVRLLAAPTPPSRLGDEPDVAGLVCEPRYGEAPDDDEAAPAEQRNRWLRHSITRRVLDDPVVYLQDLTAAQHGYLESISGRRVIRDAVAAAGMVLEERAEGLLAVDPDALATDTRFPADNSHVKHAALLLLDLLTAAGGPVDGDAVVRRVDALLTQHPQWGRAYQSEGGAARLADDALATLEAFGLARRAQGQVSALPAGWRYSTTQDSRGR